MFMKIKDCFITSCNESQNLAYNRFKSLGLCRYRGIDE